MPFNMNTFNKLWGVITPEEAKEKNRRRKERSWNIQNLKI